MELKEVCQMVGFHSYNYFLRVFKETTGHTLSEEVGGKVADQPIENTD